MTNKGFVALGVFLTLLTVGFVYLIGYMSSLKGTYDNPGPWYVAPTVFVSILAVIASGIGAFFCFWISVTSDEANDV